MKRFCLLGAAVAALLVPCTASAQFTRDWAVSFDGGMNLNDRAGGVVTDAAGNVYLVGSINDSSSVNPDIALSKYDAAGAFQWRNTFDGPANGQDNGFEVALGGDGSVIVVGRTTTSSTSTDILTLKYRATDGALLWARTYDGPAHSIDQGLDVAADAQGNVYVSGQVWNDAEYYVNGDWCTLKYAADGTLAWAALYDGPATYVGYNDMPIHLALDPAGNVVVTGDSPDAGNSTDIATVKYNASTGALMWENRYDLGGNATGLGLAPNGDVLVAGNTFQSGNKVVLMRIATGDGSTVWATVDVFPHDGLLVVPNSMAVDGQGNPIISVTYDPDFDNSNLNYTIQTTKYSFAAGVRMWSTSVGNMDRYDGQAARAVSVDSLGNVMVAGSNLVVPKDGFSAWYFRGTDGALLWNGQYAFPFNSDRTRKVLFDSAGNMIAAGDAINNNNAYADIFLIKFRRDAGLTGMQLVRGLLVSGTLDSMRTSDDGYLVARCGPVISSSESPLQLVITGTVPLQAPTVLSVRVEARVSIPNLSQKIELWDYVAGQWVQLDLRAGTTSDQTVQLDAPSPARFVEAGTRQVKARLVYRATGPLLSYPWRASVDEVAFIATSG
jgi:hypothetical protein